MDKEGQNKEDMSKDVITVFMILCCMYHFTRITVKKEKILRDWVKVLDINVLHDS